MLMGIFVESNKELGLMYQSYKDIPSKVKEFMDFIHKTVNYAHDEGVPKDDIGSKLAKFKSDCKTSMISPKNVDVQDVQKMIDDIQETRKEVDSLLTQLGVVRKKFRFGDNLIKGIIIKPKIYTNTIRDEDHAAVNAYMTSASKSLDWIEKVILDLMNMCDQDLNLVKTMNEVYFRECHESSDFMEEFEDEIDLSDPMNDEII